MFVSALTEELVVRRQQSDSPQISVLILSPCNEKWPQPTCGILKPEVRTATTTYQCNGSSFCSSWVLLAGTVTASTRVMSPERAPVRANRESTNPQPIRMRDPKPRQQPRSGATAGSIARK
jgi:hypothetical protein